MADRVYLDWNASAPLRPEARAAMIAAMDEVGNPSSVHAEGRRAKAIIERARAQVAGLVGCDTSEVVFTSGATEANFGTLSGSGRQPFVHLKGEHDSIWAYAGRGERVGRAFYDFSIDIDNLGVPLPGSFSSVVERIRSDKNSPFFSYVGDQVLITSAFSSSNGEIGVIYPVKKMHSEVAPGDFDIRLVDSTQSLGKISMGAECSETKSVFDAFGCSNVSFSAHKIGGAKGVGALCFGPKSKATLAMGGGQEQNRRAGTENVIGIAGFGAASEAAQRDLDNGEWDRVAEMRDGMEARVRDAAPDLIVFGESAPRLPNTSCFAVPGWRGETQVMQMDLAGFAVSAGSACSSGKVNKASRVLLAMGFDEITASSAIRVSMGPTTKPEEVEAFADAWIQSYRRWKQRAA